MFSATAYEHESEQEEAGQSRTEAKGESAGGGIAAARPCAVSGALVWPRLAAAWPRARYIFLLRHPAAIVESVLARRAGSAREEVVPEVLRYAEGVEAARRELPGLTVRYEELTAEPDRVTKEVCSFLDVEWERTMLDYGRQDHGPYRPYFGDWSENLRSGAVRPARPLPGAAGVPPELRDVAGAWGYLDRP